MTFAIILVIVLLLSSAYLLWQWYIGDLAGDDDHECYDQGYGIGADDGDEIGYARGREDERSDVSEPLRTALQEIADLQPNYYQQSRGMDAGDWQAIAEGMYERAVGAL